MQIKSWALLCWLLMVAVAAQAQDEKKKERFYFSSINSVAFVFGEAEKALNLQSINGVRHRGWFGGIGAGLDYYYWRSVPLFVDLRRQFATGKTPLFLYADAGVNIPWLKEEWKQNGWYESSFKVRPYWAAGAGVSVALRQNKKVLLSAGYSTKHLRESKNYFDILWPGRRPSRKEQVDYTLRTVQVSAGFQF